MSYRVRRASSPPPIPPRDQNEWLPVNHPRPCPIPGCHRKRATMNYPKEGPDGTQIIRVGARCPYHKAAGDDAPSDSDRRRESRAVTVTDPALKCLVPSCDRLRSYLYRSDAGVVTRHPVCTMHRGIKNWRSLVPPELFTPRKRHIVKVERKPKPIWTGIMENVIADFHNIRVMLEIDRADLVTWYDRWREETRFYGHHERYAPAQILKLWERPNRASLTSKPRPSFRDEAQLLELFAWFDQNYATARQMAKIEG